MSPTFNDESGKTNSVTVKVVKSPCCIKVKLNDTKFLALVSTGNGFSAFSRKVLNDLNLELDEAKEELITVSLGPPLEAIGTKTVSITIGKADVTHKFYVVKSLIEDFFIGTDIIFGKFGGFTFSSRFWIKRITLGSG